ncbi:MAG: hypothetical protein JOY89_20330 [Solirubrobacterales bacterium]|nr:hypothetical protein [Solirubrobacterales bacterium]
MPMLAVMDRVFAVMDRARPVMVNSGLGRRRAYEQKAREDDRGGNLAHVDLLPRFGHAPGNCGRAEAP